MARPALRRASINARSVCAAKFLLVIIHSGCVCLAVFVFSVLQEKQDRMRSRFTLNYYFFVCFFVVGGEWKATVAVNVSLEQGTSGFGNALMHRSTN